MSHRIESEITRKESEARVCHNGDDTMSKWGKTEYKCKCECVIKGREKKRKMVVQLTES